RQDAHGDRGGLRAAGGAPLRPPRGGQRAADRALHRRQHPHRDLLGHGDRRRPHGDLHLHRHLHGHRHGDGARRRRRRGGRARPRGRGGRGAPRVPARQRCELAPGQRARVRLLSGVLRLQPLLEGNKNWHRHDVSEACAGSLDRRLLAAPP
ncbi:unnamed protein product, partial [Prorocentrum cordatum]